MPTKLPLGTAGFTEGQGFIGPSEAARITAAQAPPNDTGGEVFYGGSSYSGADIKAVVHIYDGQPGIDNQLRDINRNTFAIERDLADNDLAFKKAQARPGSLKSKQIDFTLLAAEKDRLLQESALASSSRLSVTNSLPKKQTKVMAEIQTLTISSHREKQPVRALGNVYPRSFTRGPRMIAGSMVFTVFSKQVLEEVMTSPEMADLNRGHTSYLIDQIPPFDISIAFANEYGQMSMMTIYGVELINEGQTMSIQDLMLESVVQYVARDYDPMSSLGNSRAPSSSSSRNNRTATDAVRDPNFQKRKGKTPFLKAASGRSNPFI